MPHQTFWKPEKKEKVKTLNSLKNRKPKQKKEQPEWKKDILSHHLSTPSKADRAEFPKSVVEEAIRISGGVCQHCRKSQCFTTHHVWGRGRGGRGVLTNAYRLCGICHIQIEGDNELKSAIIEEYTLMHGERFWFDAEDWEEYDRKQIISLSMEEVQKKRRERIAPVVDLLTVASGRKLKTAEVRLLDGMDDNEMSVFAKMMADVVAASIPAEKFVPAFGYGHFDD